MTRTDRIIGSIIGGALGDAFGGPYEGRTGPVEVDERAEWFGSDDTQLTLATCEAIVAAEEVDPAAIAERFALWYRRRWLTGLGASTAKAVLELAVGAHWALTGRKGEMAASNGAAMRIAPLAFCCDPTERLGRQMIRDVARITHHNEEAYAGGLAVVLAIRAAWDREWTGGEGLISRVAGQVPDCRVRDRLMAFAELGSSASIADVATRFNCSGYVVDSVPLAVFSAERVKSLGFRTALESLVSVGGDTDTNASIMGQIAGTALGCEKLPADMVARLPNGGTVARIATEFANFVMDASR